MSETETVTENPESIENAVDQVLVEKLADLKTIVKIDQILSSALIPGGMAADVLVCKRYLERIHQPLLKECQAHKDFARATGPAPTPAEQEAIAKAAIKRAKKAKKKGH